MGNITRTKGNVRGLVGCTYAAVAEAGGTIEAGEVVRLDSTNGWIAADASDAAGIAGLIGMLVSPEDVADGDKNLSIVLIGRITGFSGMDPGALHFISDDAGEIATSTGTKLKHVGYAEKATVLYFNPNAPANPS